MPDYFYTAQSLTGELKTGISKAKDIHQLAKNLRQEGLVLIKANEQKSFLPVKTKILEIFNAGPSLIEKLFFTRNLQLMITAGLPLPKSLDILTSLTKNKKFQTALLNIREEVTKGKSFSESLGKYPDIFSELFQNVIKVGEEGGTLEEVLKTLTMQMEREHDLKSKITGALIYPAVIICAMIGIGILMLILVVPQLSATFRDLGVELPMTTQVVMNLGDFLAKNWIFVVIGLPFFILFVWRLIRTDRGKKIIDKVSLKLPIFSPIIKNTNLAYTVRTLSSLIIAGVSLPRSLEIISRSVGNYNYQKAIGSAVEVVRTGGKLSEALKPYEDIFSTIVIQMFSVGEETGETSNILQKLADFYEEQVTNATKNLASIIEPVLMLVIGTIVGFFAVSMIQPMYSMLGAIQ